MTFVDTTLELWNHLPEFKKMVQEGIVPKFGGELTEENKRRVFEIEKQHRDTDLRIIAIIEHDFFGARATAYIYVNNEDSTEPSQTDNTIWFWARVDNHRDPWCSEMGLVGIIEVNGELKRIG